jgi:deoxyribose-phosphate aldolase
MTPENIASHIDHTNLHAEATKAKIKMLCHDAKKYAFAAICIHPCYIELAKNELKGCDVAICTVIGFPLGANTTEIKVAETKQAIQDGATEIDMVINLGMVKGSDESYVRNEIREIRNACGPTICLKLILEMSALNNNEKQRYAQMGIEEGVDYLKTSTGTHGNGGASLEDVQLLITLTTGTRVKVKAAGGIRDLKSALSYLQLGAHRLGTSAGVQIIKESSNEEN